MAKKLREREREKKNIFFFLNFLFMISSSSAFILVYNINDYFLSLLILYFLPFTLHYPLPSSVDLRPGVGEGGGHGEHVAGGLVPPLVGHEGDLDRDALGGGVAPASLCDLAVVLSADLVPVDAVACAVGEGVAPVGVLRAVVLQDRDHDSRGVGGEGEGPGPCWKESYDYHHDAKGDSGELHFTRVFFGLKAAESSQTSDATGESVPA